MSAIPGEVFKRRTRIGFRCSRHPITWSVGTLRGSNVRLFQNRPIESKEGGIYYQVVAKDVSIRAQSQETI